MVDKVSAAPIAFATAAFSGIVTGNSRYSPILGPKLGAVPLPQRYVLVQIHQDLQYLLPHK